MIRTCRLGFSNYSSTVIDDRYVYGLAGGVGYPFYFCDCSVVLAPVIGYAYDQQNIRIDDSETGFCQSSGEFFATSGGNRCCRQTFISRWYGPFVGLDFNYKPWDACWNLYADLEYHWGDFRGKRNHGDSGASFLGEGNRSSHKATGWLFAAGAEYDLCNNWVVGLSVKYQDWDATRNHSSYGNDDSDYSCSGRARTTHKWHSFAVNLTFGRDF